MMNRPEDDQTGQDILWVMYRVTEFRQYIKEAETITDWVARRERISRIYKDLQYDIIHRLIYGNRGKEEYRKESHGGTDLVFKDDKECIGSD